MKKYIYSLEFKVRDYELDSQGIVNNSVYQNYLEHTRHEFLTELGLDFVALHNQGVDLVVARLEMSFKTPLKSNDTLISKLNVEVSGVKYIFYQDIFRASDQKHAINATVTAVAVVNGRLGICNVVEDALKNYQPKEK